MSDRNQEKKVLLLLKLDAQGLYQRLVEREKDYMNIFSLKRTKDHFKHLFISKYYNVSFKELLFCSEEVILTAETFYNRVDDIKWYLLNTEDMPNTVEDNLKIHLKKLKKDYDMLKLYIEAGLGQDEI